MAAKYKEYVDKMLAGEDELFKRFQEIHDKFTLDQGKYQEEFNSVGKEVMEVVKDYEDRLCRRSEVGGYGAYTGNLAEKFMDEVRRIFPNIDSIGVVRKQMAPIEVASGGGDNFFIKKINF